MTNIIRVCRAEIKETQQNLADAVGVSRQTINAIEGYKFTPSAALAIKIARHFNKTVEEVFSLDEND